MQLLAHTHTPLLTPPLKLLKLSCSFPPSALLKFCLIYVIARSRDGVARESESARSTRFACKSPRSQFPPRNEYILLYNKRGTGSHPTPRDVIAGVRQHDFCFAPRCVRSLWGERGSQHVGYMTAHHDRLLKVGQSFVTGVRDFHSARQQFWQRWVPVYVVTPTPAHLSSSLRALPLLSSLLSSLLPASFSLLPSFQLPSPRPFLSFLLPFPLLSSAPCCLSTSLCRTVWVVDNRRSFVALWDAGAC